MSKIDNGGPAFPCEQHETQDGTWNQTFESGMTLRDWFAGQALAGLCAKRSGWNEELDVFISEVAFKQADAMLKAREQHND